MGMYKEILNLEIEVVKFHKNFIIDLQTIIDLFDATLGVLSAPLNTDDPSKQKLKIINLTKKIALLREYQNEVIYTMTEFQKNIALFKKDITQYNISSVFSDISKLQKNVFNTINLFNDYKSTIIASDINLINPVNNNIHTSIIGFIEKYKPLATELFKKTIKELNNDIKIIDAIKSDSKSSFKNLFGFSHEHKIELWKEMRKRKIFVRFINKVDFGKTKYNVTDSIEEFIQKRCQSIITANEEYTEESLKIKCMNTRQLEQKSLEIIKNTFTEVIDKRPELIRDSIKRINIELVYASSNLGTYVSSKSDFIEMFIRLKINDELLNTLAINSSVMIPKSDMCDTIIHELTHAFDWRLNTRSEDLQEFENLNQKISGNKASIREARLANILTQARNEGMAEISGLIRENYTGPYINIRINLLFTKRVQWNKLLDQEQIFSQDFNKAYYTGVMHEAGKIMTMILFMYETRGKFLYHKKEEDIMKIRSSSILSQKNMEEIAEGQTYIMSAEPGVFANEIKNFIKKLSLTPPELFLKKYEKACADFNIKPIISKYHFEEKYTDEMYMQDLDRLNDVLRRKENK